MKTKEEIKKVKIYTYSTLGVVVLIGSMFFPTFFAITAVPLGWFVGTSLWKWVEKNTKDSWG